MPIEPRTFLPPLLVRPAQPPGLNPLSVVIAGTPAEPPDPTASKNGV